MSEYKVETTHNVALLSLDTLVPQPKSEGVKPTRRISMGDGSVLDQGLYVELVWEAPESATEVETILGMFGLDTEKSQEVTIYARNDLYQWKRYNGLAIRPIPSWQNYFVRDMTILVRNLVELA